MSKSRKAYFCSSCGYESPKWTGKCPACDAWNSFTEEILHKGNESLPVAAWRGLHPTQTNTRSRSLAEVASHEVERILTFDPELNRVLGEAWCQAHLYWPPASQGSASRPSSCKTHCACQR